MFDDEIERIGADLAVMRRAMGLHPSFGKGMLVFGIVLTFAAIMAGLVSLLTELPWMQVGPFAICSVLCLTGLYAKSRRNVDMSDEVKLQVTLSVTAYFAVLCAACGYLLAAFCGPSIGTARTAGLYAASLTYIVLFSIMFIAGALRTRERHYCLGLALSLLLTGLILPVVDPHRIFPIAHFLMAVGYLMGVVIQWHQLRQAEAHSHASN